MICSSPNSPLWFRLAPRSRPPSSPSSRCIRSVCFSHQVIARGRSLKRYEPSLPSWLWRRVQVTVTPAAPFAGHALRHVESSNTTPAIAPRPSVIASSPKSTAVVVPVATAAATLLPLSTCS